MYSSSAGKTFASFSAEPTPTPMRMVRTQSRAIAARRPVLIVSPPSRKRSWAHRRIAWDGIREAVRGPRDALPLMRDARRAFFMVDDHPVVLAGLKPLSRGRYEFPNRRRGPRRPHRAATGQTAAARIRGAPGLRRANPSAARHYRRRHVPGFCRRGEVVGRPARDAASPQAGQTADLSARETDVPRLVARGHSNKEIPARLNISVKTFETYKARGWRSSAIGPASRLFAAPRKKADCVQPMTPCVRYLPSL